MNRVTTKQAHNKNIDLTLLTALLTLIALGLVMVASSSIDTTNLKSAYPLSIFTSHLLFVCLGLFLMAVLCLLPITKIEQWNWFAITTAILLLVIVLVAGREVKGSLRWLSIAGLSCQPSELAKLLVIIYISGYLSRHINNLRSRIVWFIKPFIVLIIVAALLLAEPDFGTTVTLTIAVMGMIFIARARLTHFFVLLIVVLASLSILTIIEPYRLVRISSYMDPWSNAFGSGYQLTQSLIAIGRGGWFGLGLGNSIQKLFYLPEAHNDFIFAILAEELGLVGCIILILLYSMVFYRVLLIANSAINKNYIFHGFLAYGIILLFITQVIFNIGVNIGLLPTKGLVLPLISYGGSNLVISCIEFGMLFRIDYELKNNLKY